ncbi:NAD-P-binding protein [Vararia minispora EC-137]|uniref:NAD-P-binding protein n=1 Tax=Vararia minispora EC-137 TaxID=1314806 RepID=A0ACB8QS70_9AGAM|nr:NAD-P-binding protein [Vararia minispora EC-137]
MEESKQLIDYGGIDFDASLPVTLRNSLYPAIDPRSAFDSKSFAGKAVLITGASRGIGQTVALFYATAGAAVALVARSSLDQTTALLAGAAPDAKILTFVGDVRDSQRAEEVVKETVGRFGKLDVLVANAGVSNPFTKRMGEVDAKEWWNTLEVNLFGVFNYVRASLEHLNNALGYAVVLTSTGAIARTPCGSDYLHALVRLVELIPLEYPSVKTFALHPGAVDTALAIGAGMPKDALIDSPELAAGTILALTSGRFDWLRSRYVEATWDLGEVERDWKDKIVGKKTLVNALALP